MKKILIRSYLLISFLCVFTFRIQAQDDGYRFIENIGYYPSSISDTSENIAVQCVLDIYYPTDKNEFSTIVWFHGGGLTSGNKSIPEALKGKGIAIVSANYRLSPKVKAAKAIEDAAAAVAWAFKNIKSYGGSVKKIFVSGHSAGGYLTSMIGLDTTYLAKYDVDANNIAGLIPFSGHAITHFTIRAERGISGTQAVVDEYAPLYHVHRNAPPYIMITGDRDLELLGRYEENAYMWRMMKLAGHQETLLHELDGYGHQMTEPAFPLLIKYVKEISAR